MTTGTSGQPDGEPDRIWSGAPYRVGAVIWSLSRIAQLRALLDFRGLAELLETAVVTGAEIGAADSRNSQKANGLLRLRSSGPSGRAWLPRARQVA